MARVRAASVKITAFDFTWAQIRHANRSASHSSLDGWRVLTTRRPPGSDEGVHGSRASATRSRSCDSIAPRIDRRSTAVSIASKPVVTTRMLVFLARTASAASSTDGAITASMKVETIASAAASSIGRLSATMPPNAARWSASRARRYASAAEAPIAAPHGLVCLITTAAGSSNSRTMRAAASRSSKFVYESSLPCRMAAPPRPPTFAPRAMPAGRYHAAFWCGFSP